MSEKKRLLSCLIVYSIISSLVLPAGSATQPQKTQQRLAKAVQLESPKPTLFSFEEDLWSLLGNQLRDELKPHYVTSDLYDPNHPIVRLAKAFQEITFPNNEMRVKTLSQFCNSTTIPLLTYIKEPLLQATEHLSIDSVSYSPTPRQLLSREQLLLFARYRCQLLAGDCNDYIQGLKDLPVIMAPPYRGAKYRLPKSMLFIFNIPRTVAQALRPNWTQKQMATIAEASRSVLLYTPKPYQGYARSVIHDLPLYHFLAGQKQALETFLLQLPDDIQQQLKPVMTKEFIYTALPSYLWKNKHLTLHDKLMIYASLENNPKDLLGEGDFKTLLEQAIKIMFLDPQDIQQAAEELMTMAQNKAMAWEDLAVLQVRYGHADLAGASWLKSIEHSNNKYDRWERQLEYLEYLRKQKEIEKAQAYLKDLNADDWPRRLQQKLTVFKQSIDQHSPASKTSKEAQALERLEAIRGRR